MYKKILAFVCAVVVFGFLFYSIAIRSVVSASEPIESGGSGGSANIRVEEASDDNYQSSDAWNAALTWLESSLDGDGKNVLERFLNSTALTDLCSFATGAVGAIFTDQTFENVFTNFKALWANVDAEGYTSADIMHDIFYLGRDGNLYFTDDFIENAQNISDENVFLQGIVKIPTLQNSDYFSDCYSVSSPQVNSVVNNALSGSAPVLIMGGVGHNVYIYTGSNVFVPNSGTLFSSYSAYLAFLGSNNAQVLITPYDNTTVSCYSINLSSGDTSVTNFHSYLSLYSPVVSTQNLYTGSYSIRCVYIGGSFPFYLYNTSAWADYYLSGGTGALLADTGYDLNSALSSDFFDIPWSTVYDNWQSQYEKLAGEVAEGNKTLGDIRSELSTDISDKLDNLDDIANSVENQVSYLKKILSELKDISKKLTYSNVVGTIDTIADVLGSVGTWVNGLFDDGLDDISNILSDDLINSFETSFPFSLPYDVALVVNLMAHDPVQPEINFRINLPSFGIDYTYEFDQMDNFETIAKLTRFFSTIFFIMWMLNLTHKYTRKD